MLTTDTPHCRQAMKKKQKKRIALIVSGPKSAACTHQDEKKKSYSSTGLSCEAALYVHLQGSRLVTV